MRMIINTYFTIINKKCKYKLLHLGSENQLNKDRVREIQLNSKVTPKMF